MTFDVIVSGGGPNGLMTACELALAGVRVVVLEQRPDLHREPRANGLVGQVIPLLDRRGLYERLIASTQPPAPAPHFMFAAFPLPLEQLDHNPLYTTLVPQRQIEELLSARAAELGVQVHRAHSLIALSQQEDRVVVDVEGPDGAYRLEAAYLVGADGGHSSVRKLAGIGFPGVTSDSTVSRTAIVKVPDELRDPATGGLRVPGYGVIPPFLHHRTERGVVTYARFPDGRELMSAMTTGRPGTGEPFTVAELRAVLAYVLGVEDVPIGEPDGPGPHDKRRLTGGNTRLAERYRDGRVLLVGDAAHVHSAIGGSGLNLGLQDAVNLAWKLAATVHGWAPAGLLDTYESERRPAGSRVTTQTQAQSVLMGPGPEVTALRAVFGELLSERATVAQLAALIAGSDIRYATASASPLAGRFAPDLGPALRPAFRAARPVLADTTGTLAEVAAPWRDRVDVVAIPADGPTALLIRPDCYVAWATDRATPDPAEVRAALTEWFGAPAAAAGAAQEGEVVAGPARGGEVVAGAAQEGEAAAAGDRWAAA